MSLMNISKELFGGPNVETDPMGWFQDMQNRVARLNKNLGKLQHNRRAKQQ